MLCHGLHPVLIIVSFITANSYRNDRSVNKKWAELEGRKKWKHSINWCFKSNIGTFTGSRCQKGGILGLILVSFY